MTARVAWIATAPVKGMRLQHRHEVEVTHDGIPGDRAFFLVDGNGAMVNGKRLGRLLAIEAGYDAGTRRLELHLPDCRPMAGTVELGAPEDVRFFSETVRARPVVGPFAAALSEHFGEPLRIVAAPPDRGGVDRGNAGTVTLFSVASLERLRDEAGALAPVDPRRFRMTFGVEGLSAHEEDGWIGGEVWVGDALLRAVGNVGRRAVTTRNPDTGVVDFRTLHHLQAYRGATPTTEPLPFGVHLTVVRPGRFRLGDQVALAER